jgi:deazaflavin-dependent oxidoreductase (nitroreductase family)
MATRRLPSWAYRLIGWFGTSRPVAAAHAWLYRRIGGRGPLGRSFGVAMIMVAMTGARTGLPRDVPLFGVEDGPGRYLVIGSNAGREKAPAWIANLRAHPDVRVLAGRASYAARARELEGEQRERAWARAVAAYPGYADYASWTTRRIPVFVLEPA